MKIGYFLSSEEWGPKDLVAQARAGCSRVGRPASLPWTPSHRDVDSLYGSGAVIGALQATAKTAAGKLAGVYRRNPAWIYQGETIAVIVQDSLTMLEQCRLHRAAQLLSSEQAAARRHDP